MSQGQHGNEQREPRNEPRGERKGERASEGRGEPDAERDAELLRAQDLLARTVRFLEHCAQDPLAALAAENPRELIRELEALRSGAQPKSEPSVEPRTIPLRHRRSA